MFLIIIMIRILNVFWVRDLDEIEIIGKVLIVL